MKIKLCKTEGLAKHLLKNFTVAQESQGLSFCEAGGRVQVTVGAGERHLVWNSQSFLQLFPAELELIIPNFLLRKCSTAP